MVKGICEGKGECCTQTIGGTSFHVGCYDSTQCESCDSVNGKIIKGDPELLRLQCKKCTNGGSISVCTNDEPDCCYGICYNAKCKKCNDSTKMTEDRCTNGQICCDNSDHTGIGCYDPNANKCKKCDNGQLINKCSGDTPHCCPDNGNCIDDSCQNCDGSQKCTGNTWCCNCGSSKCCDKCEKCENGNKVNVGQDLGPCEKCENGEVKPKCRSNQGCCNGECYDYGCQSCPGGIALIDNCEQNDPSTRCCNGSCYSLSDKCKYCENNILKTYCSNRTDGKTSCCPSDGSCYNGSDPCYDDCTKESRLQAGQECCINSSTNRKVTYFPNINACCGGVVVPKESCCSGENITNSSIYGCCPEAPEPGGSKYNRNAEGCCNNKDRYNIDTQECCNNTVINKDTQICCGGKAVTKEQGKECCSSSGTLYSPKCEECTSDGVVPSDGYDSGCYECDPIKGPVSRCSKQGLSCCSNWGSTGVPGSCYSTQAKCDTCNPTTGTVTSKCADSSAGPDCCFGDCWDSQKDKCSRCNQTTGIERLETNKCADNIFGKTSCCDDDGGCYGGCDSCSGGVQSNSLCKDRTDGKTSCCDVGGSSQCYNASCESCYPGNPPLQNNPRCKSCCNKNCCEGDCCVSGSTETCCGKNETCSNGKCCPQGQINCGGECCAPSSCNGGKCECPTGQQLCGGECCQPASCISGKCGCPTGQELCGGECCKPSDCNNGKCGCPMGQIPCPTVGECCDIAACCQGVCLGDDETCCDQSTHTCCTKLNGKKYFECALDENCCGDVCCENYKTCCNNKDCCDVSCCSGPNGGCYNADACEECIGGRVTSKCNNQQGCCAGVCYNPKECETCQNGQIRPYSPSKPDCYCASGSEICNCSVFPTGWSLNESGSINYGSGGMSPISPNSDTFAYDGIPPTFNSSYCYTGYMSISVTCSDGSGVVTSSFTSYCGIPNALPLQTSNPCCP